VKKVFENLMVVRFVLAIWFFTIAPARKAKQSSLGPYALGYFLVAPTALETFSATG
jgi:hypothetical protein